MKTFPISELFKGRELTPDVSVFRCNHCGQRFFAYEALADRKNVGLRAIPCPYCKQSNFELDMRQFGIIVLKLESAVAQELANNRLIERDLDDVVSACDKLVSLLEKNEIDELVCASLWTHALIKYARCFPEAHGKRHSLDIGFLKKLQGINEAELTKNHEYFMAFRSRHVAHSVNAFEQAATGVVVSAPDEDDKEIINIGVLDYRVTYSQPPIIAQLRELATHALAYVRNEINQLQQTLLVEVKAKSFPDLYNLQRLNLIADLRDPSKRRKG